MKRVLAAFVALLASACGLIVGLKDRPLYDGGADATEDGAVDAGGDAPCDGNYDTDDDNCGRCGHGCLGGKCSKGMCQPVIVATTTRDGGTVRSVTLDETSTNVYFGSAAGFVDGIIESCPTSGCDAGTVLTSNLAAPPFSIATAGGQVYWAETAANGPKSVSVDGGTVTSLESGNLPNQMLMNDGHLYWPDARSPNSAVRTCTPPLCGATYDTSVTPLLSNGSTAIAIHATTLYIANEFTSSLQYCTLSNCNATLLDVGAGKAPDNLAADDNFLYFTDINANNVWRCPANSACGTPTAVATGQATPTEIAIDGSYLYWTNAGTALAVCKLPAPCTANNTFTYTGKIAGLAFDTSAIYFGNGPTVMRLAKP